jgi:hypothetical protein
MIPLSLLNQIIISTINTVNNISCYGLTDGSVTLNISGGTPPFVEDWAGFNPNALSTRNLFIHNYR